MLLSAKHTLKTQGNGNTHSLVTQGRYDIIGGGQNTPTCFKFVRYCRNVITCTKHALNSIFSGEALEQEPGEQTLLKGTDKILTIKLKSIPRNLEG